MDTQKLIARLRERAATQDACGCWSLDRTAADELERLAKIETTARAVSTDLEVYGKSTYYAEDALRNALGTDK